MGFAPRLSLPALLLHGSPASPAFPPHPAPSTWEQLDGTKFSLAFEEPAKTFTEKIVIDLLAFHQGEEGGSDVDVSYPRFRNLCL